MILIFSSSVSGEIDTQDRVIISNLRKSKIPFRVINPHHLLMSEPTLVQRGESIRLFLKGREVLPKVIYLSNLWRTDGIISFPPDCIYPSLFRMRVLQFLQDIRFSFGGVKWVPGEITAIERSDSKPFVFSLACKLGIKIPGFTINSTGRDIKEDLPLYRKNLGFPFNISLNKTKGVEVAVTVVNSVVEDLSSLEDDIFWQWQPPIFSSIQIRCFVVRDKVWSVMWDKPKGGETKDFRLFNQIEGEKSVWRSFELPSQIRRKIIALNRRLGLQISSPEFLVEKQSGELVLIDVNPCGDWYGFFGKETRKEIGLSLSEVLIGAYKEGSS